MDKNASNSSSGTRMAGPADAPAIARLFAQLGYSQAADSVADRLRANLADCAVLVAVDGDAVSGVLVMHVVAPLHVPRAWGLISALVVDERQRSGGVGALLIDAAHRLAQQRGCAHLELSCSEKRTRAHDFYAARGFNEVRKRFVRPIPDSL